MKIEKGGAVQNFGDLINMVKRLSEAVHSTWRTDLITVKKVLRFAQRKTEFRQNFAV